MQTDYINKGYQLITGNEPGNNMDALVDTIINLPIKELLFMFTLFVIFSDEHFDKYIKLNNMFEKASIFVATFLLIKFLIMWDVL